MSGTSNGAVRQFGLDTWITAPFLEPDFLVRLSQAFARHLQDQSNTKSNLFSFWRNEPQLVLDLLNCFFASETYQLASSYLRHFSTSPAVVSGRVCTIRHHQETGTDTTVAWHQDANLFNHHAGFTVWTPMSDAGETRRSLTFLDTRGKNNDYRAFLERVYRLRVNRDAYSRGHHVNESDVSLEALLGPLPQNVTPPVKAGFSLGFGHTVFHRSQVLENAQPRTSIELRLVPRDSIKSQKFEDGYFVREPEGVKVMMSDKAGPRLLPLIDTVPSQKDVRHD
jgi:hypothetical protein